MGIRKPRIAEADYISNDILIQFVGEWLRTPAYNEGHKLAQDASSALCGRPLMLDASVWDNWAEAFERLMGKELHPWYVAIDRRKGSKCAKCANRNTRDTTRIASDPLADTSQNGEVSPNREHSFTPHATTPADRLVQARLRTKVALLKRELGATEVS